MEMVKHFYTLDYVHIELVEPHDTHGTAILDADYKVGLTYTTEQAARDAAERVLDEVCAGLVLFLTYCPRYKIRKSSKITSHHLIMAVEP